MPLLQPRAALHTLLPPRTALLLAAASPAIVARTGPQTPTSRRYNHLCPRPIPQRLLPLRPPPTGSTVSIIGRFPNRSMATTTTATTSSISTATAATSTVGPSSVKKYAILVCDIQEGFRPAIHEFLTVISTARKLVNAAAALSIPLFFTTQNASRLGATVSELVAVLPPSVVVHDKTLFSMAIPEILNALHAQQITSVALVGIESHVCILQSALDLLRAGFDVYALQDGISSCNPEEVPIAIARMRQEGVRVSTSESWLYEVMGDASRKEFRDLLKVVKGTKESTKEALKKLCRSSL